MPFCGFHIKMVSGLATFAEGLFAATLERAQEKGIGIEEAYRQEVEELGSFLEALEDEYQRVKATEADSSSRGETMSAVARWISSNERKRAKP